MRQIIDGRGEWPDYFLVIKLTPRNDPVGDHVDYGEAIWARTYFLDNGVQDLAWEEWFDIRPLFSDEEIAALPLWTEKYAAMWNSCPLPSRPCAECERPAYGPSEYLCYEHRY